MAERKEYEELTVITKVYDLILWSCHHTSRFPRNHRFVLGERIERNLYELLETLSDEQMCQATLENQWSVKDVLAHIAAWEKRCVGWIQAGLRGEKPDKPEAGYTWEVVDRLNEKTFQENRERPLNAVQAAYRQAHQEMLAQVQALSEDDITNPQRFSWTNGRNLVPYIAANTYEHYQEHVEQIRKWMVDKVV